MLTWQSAALTDVGCQRQKNEDNHYISPDNRVFIVADGMGGALGGAKASSITCETLEAKFKAAAPSLDNEEAIKNWIQDSINAANLEIFQQSKDPSYKGMGTTIVAAVQVSDNKIMIGHVGDSRAYLIRNKSAKLLTNDHSVVQEMVRAGRLTEEQARINPYKNLITRCLGHDEKVEVDFTTVDLQSNDWIIICSDGLTTVLLDEQIAMLTNRNSNPQDLAKELIKNTLDGGAPDNVTVIVVHYS